MTPAALVLALSAAAATPPDCVLQWPAELRVPASGGQVALALPAGEQCSLIIGIDAPWLLVERRGGGLVLDARRNDTATPRHATVSAATGRAGWRLHIEQAAPADEFIRLDLEISR